MNEVKSVPNKTPTHSNDAYNAYYFRLSFILSEFDYIKILLSIFISNTAPRETEKTQFPTNHILGF